MTTLRERMTSDLRVRDYSPKTIDAYVRQVAQFAKYYGESSVSWKNRIAGWVNVQ